MEGGNIVMDKLNIKKLEELVKECTLVFNPMDIGVTTKELKEMIRILKK